MKCNASTSSVEYKDKYIFDVNVTRIKRSCSYALLQDGHDNKSSDKLGAQFMYILVTVFLSGSFLV